MNRSYARQIIHTELPLDRKNIIQQLIENVRRPELLKDYFQISNTQYDRFLSYYDQLTVSPLTPANKNHAGSYRHLLCGLVISDVLHLGHAVLGALLCPTGGICGRKNSRLDCCVPQRSFISHHACVHDALGFCKVKFNKGCGYNYTGGKSILKTTNPMSGQISGLMFWMRIRVSPNAVLPSNCQPCPSNQSQQWTDKLSDE